VANIKSAKKRIKVTTRRREENRGKKTELATAIKKFRALVAKKEFDEASSFLPKVYSLIDSGNSHGRLHKNTAARKKARLAAMLDKAMKSGDTEVVAAPKAKVAKPKAVKIEEAVEVKEEVKEEKPAAKKTVAKKAPAKKAPAKKAPAKKEA
jgi:small subunit ribosomal protein S20